MGNRNQSAEELFEAVLDMPQERRTAFLDQACRHTPGVRQDVDKLIRDHERLGSFLAVPFFDVEGTSDGGQKSGSHTGRLGEGTKLGRYSIVEPLGEGGMGVVYRAHDDTLERSVAIKMLAPGLLMGEEAHERFRREALVLAKLSHPHIASIYDVGQQHDINYIVMECVPGESLESRLKHGAFSMKEATIILLQIAEALDEAHEHGVIHRDLKPANVMLTPKGNVKVLDFGIAKLLTNGESVTMPETIGIVGTPRYMSPEQARGDTIDIRTDLWNLGVIYYEMIAGRAPFAGDRNLAILRSITEDAPLPIRELRPETPAAAQHIIRVALEKDPAKRYQTAAEMGRDASALIASLSGQFPAQRSRVAKRSRAVLALALLAIIALVAAGAWRLHATERKHWATEQALPQIAGLGKTGRPLAAFLLLNQAQKYIPSDPRIKQFVSDNTMLASIASSSDGAQVAIQDYSLPDSPWYQLGTTPLNDIRIPRGYFRWRVSKSGIGSMTTAPLTEKDMAFPLDASVKAPTGMVLVPAGKWADYISFVGWQGPYDMPAYYADRYEVTNRDYQKFVDGGGYENKQYWPAGFESNGRTLTRDEAMAQFRDATGRPGPSSWVGGHFPEGKADYPVSGVSWFEASAYAAFAGRTLPTLAQWFQLADPSVAGNAIPISNISTKALAPVGVYKGLGSYGTYDMAGNVREWVINSVDDNLRFILGGSWRSPDYLYFCPEALNPYDRSDTNGFRTVKNIGTLPEATTKPIQRSEADYSKLKPISDEVFHAYQLLYAYPHSPLNAKSEGIVKETADWREEKITFDTAYGDRMSAYLYLPKNTRPPYQTVLFFPSARVQFLPAGVQNGELGDTKFFDYVVQSGRAVLYPIYQQTYDRRASFYLPTAQQNIEITEEWYKDAARSVDYLATRSDIDSGKLAYLGVSMGSAAGVIISTLMQDRLKTAIFLDGGYFLETPPAGGNQADYAPRMKKPVLMVNGRYDFTFSVEKSQNPLFSMLGTPADDKQHVILDTPHDVTEQRPQLVKTVLDWLDKYLGRIEG